MENIWILIIAELVLLYIAYFFTNGDFFSPSVITLLMFIGSTLCILINHSSWNVKYDFYTSFVVISGLVLILFVDIYNRSRYLKKEKLYSEIKKNSILPIHPNKIINHIYIIILFVAILYFIMHVRKLGAQIGTNGLIAIGAVKDSTDVSISGVSLICYDIVFVSSFVYIYIFVNNVIINKERFVANISYCLPVCFGVIATIFRGNRGALVQIIVASVTMVVLLYRWKNGYKSINIAKATKKLVPVSLIIIILFYYLREIVKGRKVTTTLLDYTTYYFGSPLYLFNKYLFKPSRVYPKSQYFGELSFVNFYNYFYSHGITNHKISRLNYLPINKNISLAGNEYSFFMRPYHDFGLVGMWIFTFLFYFIFSASYYKLTFGKYTKHSRFNLILFSYFYFMVVMSFYYTFTAQEIRPQTPVLMLLMYLVYLALCKWKYKI